MKWPAYLSQSLRRAASSLHQWILAGQTRRRPPPFRYARVDEFPESLEPSAVYVAGEDAHMWAAAMLCPCGCGDVIELNLLKQVRPCWSVNEHVDGSVSLTPSVWRRKGCRSHFWVRRGRIVWCPSNADVR